VGGEVVETSPEGGERVLVATRGPCLGVELDLDEAAKHPYRPGNWLPLFGEGWDHREGGE